MRGTSSRRGAGLSSAGSSLLRRYRTPLLAWLLCALAVSWVQQVSYRIFTSGFEGLSSLLPGIYTPPAGRIAWDSGLYLSVAEHGYSLGEKHEAGFPLYALAIRGLSGVLGDPQTVAPLISLGAGFAATLLMWRWMELRDVPERLRTTALLLFLVYPHAFVIYGVAYSDSLLLALVMGAFVLVESDRFVAAGIVGAAATATRPTGLVLIPALVVFALERSGALSIPLPRDQLGADVRTRARTVIQSLTALRFRPGRLRPRHAGVGLSVLGIGSYMVFLSRHAGDPLYFWAVQAQYGHGSATRLSTWVKAPFMFDPTRDIRHVGDILNEIAATAAVLVLVFAAPAVGRRLGYGYAVTSLGLAVAIWLPGHWLAPGARYALPMVPVLAVLAAPVLCDRPRTRVVALGTCALTSLTLAAGFAGFLFRIHW